MSRIFRALSSMADDTFGIGFQVGSWGRAGDLICLVGDLGAGKTQLTQGIAAGLGLLRESVTSPTYSLITEHVGGRMPLYHMDAYRLDDVSELGPIGFDEYLGREDGIMVIEWADRIAVALPDERLEIELLHPLTGIEPADSRSLIIRAFGERALQHAYDALAIL